MSDAEHRLTATPKTGSAFEQAVASCVARSGITQAILKILKKRVSKILIPLKLSSFAARMSADAPFKMASSCR
ncbi:hypothetical protein FV242_20865 [Methylobacterium sp. WL64]|uniref:hypothetical protein n=1 Tax=Methylobacterium sp. WL64 TaxID=2603894 RepID=UPI0011CA1EC9|nr:hypothetical protein [Methylobacterium sp. WL64]TXN00796.1 hypothetical protein FV242_20865 [Methylobacterium sp. WL64]